MPSKGKIIRQEKPEEERKEVNTVVSILLSAHARTSQAEWENTCILHVDPPGWTHKYSL